MILHILLTSIFCFYLVSVLSVTGIPYVTDFRLDMNINLIPFVDIITNFKQYALNILLFIPLGFFLPWIWKYFQKPLITVFSGFLFSLCIEAAQLFSLRATDIDDLLTNTIGTVIGYGLYTFVRKLLPKLSAICSGHEITNGRKEVLAGVFLAFIAIFFIAPYLSNCIWNIFI